MRGTFTKTTKVYNLLNRDKEMMKQGLKGLILLMAVAVLGLGQAKAGSEDSIRYNRIHGTHFILPATLVAYGVSAQIVPALDDWDVAIKDSWGQITPLVFDNKVGLSLSLAF